LNIPLHIPYLTGRENQAFEAVINQRKFSGNGTFTHQCQQFLEEKFGFGKCLLTHSCTGALELIALLIDLKPGDEVIVPGYTFVSTANAFLLRGAKVVFADSLPNHPNVDPESVASLINPNTKAIVCVHYAGYPCDLTELRTLCDQHKLFLIEDAAQAIGAFHIAPNGTQIPAGSVGDFAAFSFHDTKNIHCGEGGACIINNKNFFEHAEILWEKGTNRNAFLRGEVMRYQWLEIGSSFLLSEIHAAFLWEQLNDLEKVNLKRVELCAYYRDSLLQNNVPIDFPDQAHTANGHLFFITTVHEIDASKLRLFLNEHGVSAERHYQNLNDSRFGSSANLLPNATRFERQLLRLPLYYELNEHQLFHITEKICTFFK
jgi:dTDP-4-amino-4,6-dideoxygalactose transaminase